MSKLTHKQQLFVNAYLECWNATEAARQAGYEGHDGTLANIGWENVRKPQIAQEIKKRLSMSAMSAEEALSRLAAMARADIGEYIDEHGIIDWKALKRDGVLVKEIKHIKGESSFRLHDSQSALNTILKYHGVLVDKTQQLNVDLGNLTTEQLERIANGEDIVHVLATSGKG